MPELYQLRQLLAVADKGTLSAAAEELHISQPALTRSMQKLEEEFGIPLFDRTKNKIVLNEAGALAVEQAKRVVDAVEVMTARMADYARSLHTISIGSCAPAPMWVLSPELSQLRPGMTITCEMRPPEELLPALEAGQYQLIITDGPIEKDGVLCRQFVTEHLYISLPPAHPLAKKDGIYLSEMAGQTMLLFADLGVWERLREEKMRDIRFIVQSDREAFSDLVSASVLPNFTSSLLKDFGGPPMDRVNIPLLDKEASITFWLCAMKKNKKLLDSIPPIV